MKVSINYKEFILYLLLREATIQSDHGDLGNPVIFLSFLWKQKDNENSAFHGVANIYVAFQ